MILLALTFITASLFCILALSTFKKNIAYNFACFWLSLGVIFLYYQTDYPGEYFVLVSFLMLSGYELYSMTKFRR